jgi:hypothetical protein
VLGRWRSLCRSERRITAPRSLIGERAHTGFGVALEAQHDLWCSVPPGSHILGHVPRILLGVHGEATGQSEIANFELAVGVDEQVARFEVAVEHICRVDVFEAAQNLVDEGLEMSVGERLARADDGGQIALHEFCAGQQLVVTSCVWGSVSGVPSYR